MKITYLQNTTQFENEISTIKSLYSWNMFPYYELQYGIPLGFSNALTVTINILPSFWHNGGKLETIDSAKQQVNPQEDYALALIDPNSRSDDFDDFKINNVTQTLEVEHSWQLVYCLEQGFKPICKPNSGAEQIYNKAKSILRDICIISPQDAFPTVPIPSGFSISPTFFGFLNTSITFSLYIFNISFRLEQGRHFTQFFNRFFNNFNRVINFFFRIVFSKRESNRAVRQRLF